MRRLRYRIINMQISVFTFFLVFLATLTLFPSHIHAQADTTQAHQYWVEAQTLRDSAKLDSAFPYYMAAGDAFWEAAAVEGDSAIVARAYVSKSKASGILSMRRDFRGANEILKEIYDLLENIRPGDIDKRVATMGSMGRNYNFMMQYAKAEDIYMQALHLHLTQEEPAIYRQIQLLTDRGRVRRDQGKWESALKDFEEAVDLCEKIEESSLMPVILFHIGMTHLRLKDYITAEGYFLQSAELFEQTDPPTPEVGKAYGNLNNCLNRQGRYTEALTYSDKCIQVIGEGFGEQSLLYAKALIGKVNVHIPMGNFTEGERYARRALKIVLDAVGPKHPAAAEVYSSLARIYQLKGDVPKAITFLQKSLEIRAAVLGPKSVQLLSDYYNFALLYSKARRYEESIDQLEFTQKLARELNMLTPSIEASIINNFSVAYSRLGKKEEALAYGLQCLEIYQSYYPSNHPSVIQAYINIGEFYRDLGKDQLGLEMINEGHKLLESRVETTSPIKFASVYKARAEILANLGRVEEAEQNYRLAQTHLDASQPALLLNRIDLDRSFALFCANEGMYQKAMDLFDACIQNIRSLEGVLQEKDAQLQFREKFADIYPAAIEASYQLASQDPRFPLLDKVWYIAEQAKSALLNQSLHENRVETYGLAPISLVREKRKVESEVARLERQLGESISEERKQGLSDQLFRQRFKADSIREIFQADYQLYYQRVYERQVVRREEVQQSLEEEAGMLTYVLGEEKAYALILTRDTFVVHSFAIDEGNLAAIQDFRQSIYAPFMGSSPSGQATYSARAHQLYNEWIAPIQSHLPSQLIIVPDGIFSYLPFEALLTESVDADLPYHSYPFLLKEKEISYAFSATAWIDAKQPRVNQRRTRGVMAIAPDFPSAENAYASAERFRSGFLGPLVHNRREALDVVDIWGGAAWIDSAATLDAFWNHVSDYQIVHLATHGKVNDRFPQGSFLAFWGKEDSILWEGRSYPGISGLYLSDLFQQQVQAELVVLSACETGVGKLYEGEGVASLARGFTQAGVKSLLTTLWSVSDEGSALLMRSFYEKMKEGKTKSSALREAKLQLIQERSEYAAPFYWSGYVLMGDEAPLETRNGLLMIWLTAGALLLLGITILLWVRRRALNS
ncbi:MAG: CHAT domain-containing tetratricopeptide repeat protein [Bacteroidota bacterium]